jgi:hypothetical protein
MEVIITPTATTAIKVAVTVYNSKQRRYSAPLTIWGWGFAGAEVIKIELPNRANPVTATDAHWDDWKIATVAQTLTANNNKIDLPAGIYRLSKTANADANGIGCAILV